MAYKITDAELEAVVQDCRVDSREPMSVKEISIGPPADAPDEPVQEGKYLHDSDGESSTESDPQSRCMLEELRTKIRMEFDTGRSSHSVMENQLQRLI